MDYLDTNDSLIKTWDDRVKPTDATYTVKGGPYEFAIELGNRTGKDIWLCVPALADDEHVRKLGELVRTKLRPDLNCFIEYSNEVWNGQFKQVSGRVACPSGTGRYGHVPGHTTPFPAS